MPLILRPEAAKAIGEAYLRALKRQAEAGLGPAKRGGQITLHGPRTQGIWDATVNGDGSVTFDHHLAFLLREYGADELRGGHLAEFEREIEPLLQSGIDWIP
jgi:hypothetical protein